jgi:hypothetical protein
MGSICPFLLLLGSALVAVSAYNTLNTKHLYLMTRELRVDDDLPVQ